MWTVKKKTSADFDFSVDSSNPADYFEASDPSIWYYESDTSATNASVFKVIDVSNQYYVLITMCDGTVFQIKTKSAIVLLLFRFRFQPPTSVPFRVPTLAVYYHKIQCMQIPKPNRCEL